MLSKIHAPECDRSSANLLAVNIERPRYDQNTYTGRVKHFFLLTNPFNLFVTTSTLNHAKEIITKHRNHEPLPECLTEDDLWKAKILYDSAYHPDTGERMCLVGRMSFQVPGNMLMNAGMLTFDRRRATVMFWQWLNQSYNAIVNYTNRSGDMPISNQRLLLYYLCATTSSVLTAITLHTLARKSSILIRKFVPFVADATADCIHVPLMRAKELSEGTPVYDEENRRIGNSRVAARWGIIQVIFTRIGMVIPAMAVGPLSNVYFERKELFVRHPLWQMPLQMLVMGFCLTIATPLACAFFKQTAEIRVSYLEDEIQEKIEILRGNKCSIVYYNKGL